MNRLVRLSLLAILAIPFLSLLPLAQVLGDWWTLRQFGTGVSGSSTMASDWVQWDEVDGKIIARYVFPQGPAAEAGIASGDEFYEMGFDFYFDVEDLKSAIASIEPGSSRLFVVRRGEAWIRAEVKLTRYPTFLYPFSAGLWRFSLWAFTFGAFIHILGLIIAAPLALRSATSRMPFVLIAVSALWMIGNWLRILLIEMLGPPVAGSTYEAVFQALTFIGLIGWIGFPVLLLRQVLHEAGIVVRVARPARYLLLYLPTVVLGLLALLTTLSGHAGPFTLDGLLVPILFYASCYIAGAAGLMALLRAAVPDLPPAAAQWSRWGSALVLPLALLVGLSVLGVVPILGAVEETVAGWIIVAAQLLSTAPIILVTLATLRYGKIDAVLSRTLTYLTFLGLIFLVFVVSLELLEEFAPALGISRNVLAGFLVVVLLLIFERIAQSVRNHLSRFFSTDRQRTRKQLNRFQEQIRGFLDYERLVQQTIMAVGEALEVRSAVMFIRPEGVEDWVTHTYHPEPPYLTVPVFEQMWGALQHETHIWARNPELNTSALSETLSAHLIRLGAYLVVPIFGKDAPIGTIILGAKSQRRSVYNLEDLDQLRALSSQLTLSIERLQLVERERTLIRETAEAQLVALRAQINPHFLFNALNTIISLIEETPEEAEQAVEHLAAIFRHILQTSSERFIPLESELALVQHYLSIEKARFGERLDLDFQIEPQTRTHPVPAFAVQTLVENAIKHGLEKKRGTGRLTIGATYTEAGHVRLTVADTGVGIPALFDASAAEAAQGQFYGIGLRNVAQRMQQLYDQADLLTLTSSPEGTTATLAIPDRPLEAMPLPLSS